MEKIKEVVAQLKDKGYKVRLKEGELQTTQNEITLQIDQDIYPLFEMTIAESSNTKNAASESEAQSPMHLLLQDLPPAVDFSVMSFARIACSHKIPIAAVSQLKAQDAYFLKVSF